MSNVTVFEECLRLITEKYGPIGQKRAAMALMSSAPPPSVEDIATLFRALLKRLTDQLTPEEKRTSNENWRFETKTPIDPSNTSVEVRLERALAKVVAEGPIPLWANQVPTASGLFSKRGGRRCVDLVRTLDNGGFELVELKVEANNPVYAAFELSIYGVLYVLAKDLMKAGKTRGFRHDSKLFQAKAMHLRVLAPHTYYLRYSQADLAAFERILDAGWRQFSSERDVPIDFGFREYPDKLAVAPELHGDSIVSEFESALDGPSPCEVRRGGH